jgi:hypothetical protein
MRYLCISISWKNSFHFMPQNYQNFRCQVKLAGPKSSTLFYDKNSEKTAKKRFLQRQKFDINF